MLKAGYAFLGGRFSNTYRLQFLFLFLLYLLLSLDYSSIFISISISISISSDNTNIFFFMKNFKFPLIRGVDKHCKKNVFSIDQACSYYDILWYCISNKFDWRTRDFSPYFLSSCEYNVMPFLSGLGLEICLVKVSKQCKKIQIFSGG